MGKTQKAPTDDSKIVKTKLTKKQIIRSTIKKTKEKFLTKSQEIFWGVLDENEITICMGPSGTGKSYVALKKAVDLLWDDNNKYEKLLLVRPAIEAEEKLGSIPGDLAAKLDPYIYPSYYLLHKIIGKAETEKLKELGIIETIPLGYLRGWNVDNTILIFEEGQNSTPSQMKLLLTRIGYNSKFFISGDIEQSDKFKDKTKNGLYDAKRRLSKIGNIGVFEFDQKDIVRNPLISKILDAYSTNEKVLTSDLIPDYLEITSQNGNKK